MYATDFWFVCPIVQLTRPDGEVCRGPGPGAHKCLTCYTPKLFPPQEEFIEALGKKYDLVGRTLDSLPGRVKGAAQAGLNAVYKASKWPSAAKATRARPAVLKDFANQLDGILVPTKLMRDIFVENGIKEQLITVTHFGIDTSKLSQYQQKTDSNLLRIGYIGTFFEHKGVDLLIEAFLSLSDGERERACLKLYGDESQFPEYAKKLHDMAEKAGVRGANISF